MGIYYLLSNFSIENGFSLIADDFRKDIKHYKSIVFIASNPSVREVTDKYVEMYLGWFEKIGIHFENKVILDNHLENKDMIKAITNASLIYLMGGTTPLQMKFLKENQLIDAIKQVDSVVMGLSAGAINMANQSILTISSGHEKQEFYKGIGLVDLSVEPHFRLDNFNDELKELSYKYLIHAICDESAIIIRGNQYSYYGDVFLLKDGNLEKK